MITGDQERKLAVWTPELSDINGQNIITRRVVNNQGRFLDSVYEYRGGSLATIPSTLWKAIRLFLSVLFGRHAGVYLVCSRSSVGFLRDVLPLATSRFGSRVVVHVHGSDLPELLERPVIGRFARWLYASCEIVVPSQHLLAPLARHSFRQLSVCENFADAPAAFGTQSKTQRQGAFVVLWNSNVMASKGISELVEGLRLLRQEGVLIELIVLGKAIADAERSVGEMRDFLESLNREKWIDVKGSVPPKEVPQLVAASDIIALPSTYSSECQPLAVIQGMLAGRLVMVTDTPAMRSTVGDYPAIFVGRNSGSIAQALRQLLQRRPGHAEWEAASQSRYRFSPDRFDSCIRHALAGGDVS